MLLIRYVKHISWINVLNSRHHSRHRHPSMSTVYVSYQVRFYDSVRKIYLRNNIQAYFFFLILFNIYGPSTQTLARLLEYMRFTWSIGARTGILGVVNPNSIYDSFMNTPISTHEFHQKQSLGGLSDAGDNYSDMYHPKVCLCERVGTFSHAYT